ncbi:hypothetical protein [Crassaminicella profunda]|uniref:hypothetical protein n=1 Tax=Crassaminicella profunda TaxID=1286698 RepID=UPI001CA6D37D|nr:hypothetical protein [Crassaminicella profunda]QZY54574.1 hypothetical protein K7H06_16260 [Crassaminicella profunda]
MKKVSQEYLLDTAFTFAVEREELLLKKYKEYLEKIKNKELKKMIKEFEKNSKEHIKLMKDMMIKINIQS